MSNELSKAFEQAANENLWSDPDSKSGPGSNLIQTQIIRAALPVLLKKFKVKVMLDVPCGDFFWMKELKQELSVILDQYIGGDIVEQLIERNNKQYGDVKFSFKRIDITLDGVPKADLIFTRDCFIHLSFGNIYKAIRNYKASNSTYILVNTYTNPRKNTDVPDFNLSGRALNLQRFPFYFPKPLEIINEGCTESNGDYSDKCLALWRLSDIGLFTLKFYLLLKAIKQSIKA
jgi:hypothetical protein